jgi:hypothetical protein
MKDRSRITNRPYNAIEHNYFQPLPINEHSVVVPEAVNTKFTTFVNVTPCSLVAGPKTTSCHITEDSKLTLM